MASRPLQPTAHDVNVASPPFPRLHCAPGWERFCVQAHGGCGGLKPLRAPPPPRQTIGTCPKSGQQEQTGLGQSRGWGSSRQEGQSSFPRKGPCEVVRNRWEHFASWLELPGGCYAERGMQPRRRKQRETGEMGALVTSSGPLNLLIARARDFAS